MKLADKEALNKVVQAVIDYNMKKHGAKIMAHWVFKYGGLKDFDPSNPEHDALLRGIIEQVVRD